MRKIIISLFILLICSSSKAQQTDSISLLKKRFDSLQSRLDEKNYTRVPNKDLEDAFRTKVKEEVNGWFSNNFLVGGGILAVLVALILTIGRKMIAKAINEKLKSYVDDKTNHITKLFDNNSKYINEKLGETQYEVKKYRQESLEIIEKFKRETKESFGMYVDKKLKQTQDNLEQLQNELNETVNPLFNQSVEGILQRADDLKKANEDGKNKKDEELIKYLERLIQKEKLPSKESAVEALDAIVKYHFFPLNTEKIEALIKKYGTSYNLPVTCYANAALAFAEKYEANNQLDFRNSCLYYCDEAIKRSFDYGLTYVIKIVIYLIDFKRAFDNEQKEAAAKEIKRIFHQVGFTKSEYIDKEVINEIKIYRDTPHFIEYIELLETEFPGEIQELHDRIEKKRETKLT